MPGKCLKRKLNVTNKKKYIVFDLDGTLANIDHRLHYISGEKKDWNSFFEACHDDDIIESTVHLCRLTHTFLGGVVILTGRSETVREKTENWLKKYHIEYENLIMRPERDFRPDHEFKYEWAKNLGFEKIWFVFEDRQSVIDMWKKNNIFCFQILPNLIERGKSDS